VRTGLGIGASTARAAIELMVSLLNMDRYTAMFVILPFSTRAPFTGGVIYEIRSRRLFL